MDICIMFCFFSFARTMNIRESVLPFVCVCGVFFTVNFFKIKKNELLYLFKIASSIL